MDNELYHYGIKGMKWGVRRYQNPDGSLTPAGKKKYAKYNELKTNTSRAADSYGKYARTIALKSKKLNSAYYDDGDDDAVVRALDDLYGENSSVGQAYRNASNRDKALLVGQVYNESRKTAARARQMELGHKAINEALNNTSFMNMKRRSYYDRIGQEVINKQAPILNNMTSTELMIDMGMNNEYTQHWKSLMSSQR